MAISSIKGAKFRSALTMFGIIVGVSSVVSIVSLGEGVRQQITDQVGEISESLIVVRPGKEVDTSIISLDALRTFSNASGGSLSEKDWRDTEKVEGVKSSVPIGVISGIASYQDNEYNGNIIASTEELPRLLNSSVEFGEFFDENDANKKVAIIGQDVAEGLFESPAPVGRRLSIRGVEYIVSGVFEQQVSGTFATVNVNNSIILPYEAAREVSGSIQLLQLFVEAESAETVPEVAESIRDRLKTNHAGQVDFSVLEREEALEATNEIFYQLTIFVAGVAFISFIVGGIGIMNIMFASVSERTKEIGIRKAIGATRGQIIGQFVMEAVVLSIFGGLLGVLTALIINGLIRVTSDLQPILTTDIALIVFALSTATGIISGILPAIQAARKDPITALRDSN